MRLPLLFLLLLSCTTLATDEVKSIKLEERNGEFLKRSTYWFRGDQCVACIRGYANAREHVIQFREFLDIFYVGKLILTCDPSTRETIFIEVPEGVTLRKELMRFTIYSKDLTYLEQVTLEAAEKSGFSVSLLDPAQVTAIRESLKQSPSFGSLPRRYPPDKKAPTLAEIQARAELKSK